MYAFDYGDEVSVENPATKWCKFQGTFARQPPTNALLPGTCWHGVEKMEAKLSSAVPMSARRRGNGERLVRQSPLEYATTEMQDLVADLVIQPQYVQLRPSAAFGNKGKCTSRIGQKWEAPTESSGRRVCVVLLGGRGEKVRNVKRNHRPPPTTTHHYPPPATATNHQ